MLSFSARVSRLNCKSTKLVTTTSVRLINSGNFAHVKRIGIIGAGVAGLQAVKTLADAGFECTVYDKAEKVGGLWQSNYSSYGLQVPKQLYEFPDFKFKVPSGYFPTGAEVQQYIEDYAKTFQLKKHIKLNTVVDKINQVPSSNSSSNDLTKHPQWSITSRNIKSNEISTQVFDYLVISTGMYSTPNIPTEFEQLISLSQGKPNDDDGETFKCIHSSQFTSNSIASNKHVVVVGAGKSAIDIVKESAKVSTHSTLVFPEAHWGTPRKIAGLIPFQYVFLSRFGQALVCWFKGTFPSENGRFTSVNAMHKILKNIMSPVFSIVEALFAFQLAHYGKFKPKDGIIPDFYGFAQVHNSDFKKCIQRQEIDIAQDYVLKVEDTIAPGGSHDNNHHNHDNSSNMTNINSKKVVVLKNSGQRIPCDLLILATGFKKDYSYLPPDVVQKLNIESDGLYLYRHCLPADVENLAFIGSEVATISNITTHKIQSEWLSRLLTHRMPSPSHVDMKKEIHALKKWKREWMSDTASRASLVLLHQIHYHDTLLQDMKIPHRRKGMNVLAELFMPYQAGDYDGLSAHSNTHNTSLVSNK